MKTKTAKLNIFNTKRLCILFLGIIVLALVTYVYSYQLSVSYASSLENLEDKISNVKSEISEVEFEIVENRRSIDKEIAVAQGFVELEEVVFIKKTSKTALNAKSN